MRNRLWRHGGPRDYNGINRRGSSKGSRAKGMLRRRFARKKCNILGKHALGEKKLPGKESRHGKLRRPMENASKELNQGEPKDL